MRKSLALHLFSIVIVAAAIIPMYSVAVQQSSGIHRNRVRTYYIAADEISWDYAPSGRDEAMGHPFDQFQKSSMQTAPHKIGRVYEKAVYREYTDATFTKLVRRPPNDQYLGILGPVLRGEVGDTIKVFFRNKASHSYSMHPHGLLYAKDSEGSGYNDNSTEADQAGDAVPPGATHVYIWQIPQRAGPGPGDPSSIVWLYHSHVDELRDVASGLFGAIIVSASGKARRDGSPLDVDREFVTMMMVINENESWYLDDNIRKFTADPKGVNKVESLPGGPNGILCGLGTGFADANLRYTINGYMFGGMPMMTMKKGEHVRWYVITLGDGNNFHTAHWHGNDVIQNGHRTDVVALSPAQMETVDMFPDNPGIWLYHCHVSDHMLGGMEARYEVLP
jgi:FtsP/CotA-like multicopper oxidase with cupredoxin domain